MARGDITLIVPQGIGDVFWVHQLVAPHFARVNYRVMIGRDHRPDVQRRLAGWVEIWERGGTVDFIEGRDADYQRMLDRPRGVKELLARYDAGETTQEFAVNRWLEAGVPLESIEPELPVAWDVAIRMDYMPIPWSVYGYIAVYVCGDTRHNAGVWTVEEWAELVTAIVPPEAPVLLIGAPYDGDVLSRLQARLQFDHGYATALITHATPAQAMYAIAGASLFISYQSGLAILAEQFRVPQVKLWFADDRHRNIKWTWVHPSRRQSRDLLFAHFDQSPADVAGEYLARTRPRCEGESKWPTPGN